VEYDSHDSDVTVAVVAPRTDKPIVRNRVTKLEFTQTKIWLFWKGLRT